MPELKPLQQFGLDQAQNLIGVGMGLMLEGHNDRRQLRQQGRLQDLQIKGQQQMVDYNYAKQLQMWKDTNYQAQMEQLKLAGLNPGLIYGMGGGGGQTTGQAVGTTTGGQAPQGGHEILAATSQALQMGIMRAQKENIEADTKKKEAEIPKTETETKSLAQGIENQKAQQKLTEVQTEISKLDAQYLKESLQDRLDLIFRTAAKATEEIDILHTQNLLDRQQREDKVTLLQLQIAEKLVQNALTSQKITESEAQIMKWATELQQAWASIDIHQKELALKTFSEGIKAKYPGLWNVFGRILNETAEGIGKLFGQKPDTTPPK